MSTSPVADGAHRADVPLDPAKASTGQLVGELPELVTRLVRDEVRLAQAEVKGKAKKLGLGIGLFGGAGLLALLGLNALITAGILGLANVIPGWLAGILVAVVLFLIAAVLGLIGKKDVSQAAPPLPTETIESLKADVATVKESAAR